MNSRTRRDLPTPGSPTSATIWPAPSCSAALSLAQAVELRRPADEAREPAHRGRLQAVAGWAGAGELVDVDGLGAGP